MGVSGRLVLLWWMWWRSVRRRVGRGGLLRGGGLLPVDHVLDIEEKDGIGKYVILFFALALASRDSVGGCQNVFAVAALKAVLT